MYLLADCGRVMGLTDENSDSRDDLLCFKYTSTVDLRCSFQVG